MERLFYSPGRTREEFRYQATRPSSQLVSRSAFSAPARGNQTVDFATNTVDSLEFPSKLTAGMRNISEKELLQGLNDRFAGFIEKVHHLENQNRALEREIESIRVRAKSSATLSKEYESDLDHLRQQVHEIGLQKHQIEMNRQNLEDEFDILREKCEREARGRADAEENISVLKKSINNAYLSKQEMDRKAKALEEEIDFLKTNHESEVAEILEQIQESHESNERMDFTRSDVTAALRDIRMQLEGHSNSDIRYAEERFRAQLAKLTKAAEVNREALMATKAEINEHRRQLQHKNIELDSVKGVREGLEKQLYDLEQRHNAEIHHYQDTIRELEFELKNAKYDMGSHLREYQDLLNVKMALDAEIYSYRKLLEGEESRYSVSDAHISVPYIYRQSPIYTLPCVKRQGEATRKAEPQYKFVEEIITETTREDVEISDTGSENEKADVENCDGEVQGEETPQDDDNEAESTDKDAGENPELVGDEVQSAEETGEKEAEPDESTESTELSPKVNPSQEPSNAKNKDEQADMKILNKPKLESEVEKEAEISLKTDEASKENEDSEQLDPKDKSSKDVHSPETTSQGSAKTSDQTVRANSQSKEGKEDAEITPGEPVLTKPSDEEHPSKPKVDPAEPSSAVKKDTSKQPEEKKHQEAPSEKEQKPEESDKAEKGKSALSTKSEKQVSESKEKEKPDKLQPTGEKTPVKSKQENSKHDGEDKAAEGKEQDETMTTDAKSKGQDKVPGKSEEIMKAKQPQSANLDVKSEVAESDITSPQTKTSEAVKPSTK